MCAAGCASTSSEPSESGIEFEGVSDVSEGTLRDIARRELRAFTSHGRRAADLADAVYAMERGVRDLGYAHAVVTVVAFPSEDDAQRVVFHVDEGPLAEPGEIRFPGAVAFRRERLLSFFRRAPRDLFGLEEPPFRLADVESGVSDVERLYQFAGYAEAVVGPATVRWNADRTVADIEVPVTEGRRFLVKSAVVEGAGDVALEADLLRSLDLVGRPWHARLAAETAATVRQAMLESGRRAAKVEAVAEVDRGADPSARVVVRVQPGPVFRLRDVLISGNERTQTEFLRGLVELEPGDVLSQDAIDGAINRFYGTGALRAAEVKTPGASGQQSGATGPQSGATVLSDLMIAVEELEARSVDAGVGWGSYERLRGHVEYRDRNLFGRATDFSVRTSASVVSAGLEATLTDRHLFGRSNAVQLAATTYTREEPSFEQRTLAAEASLRHDYRDNLYAKGGYRLRAVDADAAEGSIRGAEERGFVLSAGPFVEAVRDTRDDVLFPKGGSLVEAGLFWSAPEFGSDLAFLETKLAASSYFELGDGTVLAIGARFTTRDVQDERDTLPIQERLFLGGENSVRSFRESELGPSNAAGEPVGGLTSLVASVELRQRIRGMLDGAIFYDVGTVGTGAWDAGGPRGQAIGIGLRYRLPVGPVRLDFGWNPGERFTADSDWALHFSFGFSF